MNDDDSDEEWYSRMENSQEETCLPYSNPPDLINNEDDYFEALQSIANSQPDGFAEERDTIWQGFLRDLVKKDNDKPSHLTKLQFSNELEIIMVQQWMASHMPLSLPSYFTITKEFLLADQCRFLLVDHVIHPSIVLSVLHPVQNPTTIRIYPFNSSTIESNTRNEIVKYLNDYVRNNRESCQEIVFCCTDIKLFETQFASSSELTVNWVEHCGLFILESPSSEINLFTSVSKQLPTEFYFSELR
jgi:hypothetical protein